jgi:hypothetical protein
MAPSSTCQQVAGSLGLTGGAHNNKPFNSLTRARTGDMCASSRNALRERRDREPLAFSVCQTTAGHLSARRHPELP